MNRFWIRQSILISLLILLVMLPTTAFVLRVFAENFAGSPGSVEFIDHEHDGIPPLVIAIMAISVIVGSGVGILASRTLSRPITILVEGVRQIGTGKLGHQIPLESSTREFQELSDAINTMSKQLNSAEAQRRRMMADVSHELRTPLTVLEGHLRAALDDVYALDGRQIANLYGQTHHLIKLVDDLNLLSRAEANRLSLDFEVVNVSQVMQEVVDNFQLVADEKDIVITLDIRTQKLNVQADIIRLRQIFSNLIDNAIQHTPNRGQIHVTIKENLNQIQIAISDNGSGIESDHLPHIFDRFYRTDTSRSRDSGGSGLGLAIVKVLVEVQGGEITAYSAGVQQGTTFQIVFPTLTPLDSPKTIADNSIIHPQNLL